jgi:EAL domain-containing protein (putative c-di-GMP-specific phosphodiesterase class I)
MEITDNDALRLEVDLRHALEKQEFVLHYQPIVSIKSQETIGYEALVRWKHPERGLLLPGNFISIAETTGLIVPLGWWVLQEACQQMKQWISKFPGTESWFVSVNMSSKQFSQKYAVESIQSILERTQLSGRNLKLEVTESILISHSDSIISKLERIRDMGIKLAIDDFGTGYSSLSYLHRFPFDFLKIDRSFIEGADTDYEKLEILQSVVRLAWNLGLEVVAEGIETPKNHAQLKALNCEFGQGYLFSRPAEAKAIEATLAR